MGQERRKIIREKGIYGAPDLIIEILSPQDRPADLIALEADWSLEVLEIWFLDKKRKQVRVLWKPEKGYEERVLKRGLLRSEVVTAFSLEVKCLCQTAAAGVAHSARAFEMTIQVPIIPSRYLARDSGVFIPSPSQRKFAG